MQLDQNPMEIEDTKAILTQLGYFGYHAELLTSWEDLNIKFSNHIPSALVVDTVNFNNGNSIPGLFNYLESYTNRIKSELGINLPIIFISYNDDLEARLKAVRIGGQAFFTKPFDISGFINALDKLVLHDQPLPYKVLIIDDSRVSARFAETTLQKAGMITEIVTNPKQIMVPLQEFNPDLILLDVYMPECTGMELAKVIRQMERYVSIPIVYLSSEEDKDMQLEAMSKGADDFINKMELKGHQLISAVQTRVERYRSLRSLMMRDSLTGLLNHTSIKERLVQEIARSKRSCISGRSGCLALAMLDIDRFKSVNDTYGHSTGDQVIKSLSRFLTQRLRQSDTIGRYGGEEFAVILPDTDPTSAFSVMDGIRENFSKIHHKAEGDDFIVTFSCGLATFPEYMDASKINDAADHALYTAKKDGRNRVVCADDL